MTAYGDLSSLITEVTHAAIAADMYDRGFSGDVEHGFTGYGLSEDHTDQEQVTVTYPEGRVLMAGSTLPAGGVDLGFLPASVYAHWSHEIAEVLDPWRSLPDPADFDAAIQTLAQAAGQLGSGGTVTLEGDGSSVELKATNAELSSLATFSIDTLSQFRGAAVATFQASYASRVPIVLSGQQVLVCALGVIVTGEQEIWRRTRSDIVALTAGARDSFAAHASSGGSGGITQLFEVAETLASAAGLFTEGAGSAVAGGLALAAGVVAKLLPDADAPAPVRATLSGGSAEAIHQSLVTAVHELSTSVFEQENGFRSCAIKVAAYVDDNKGQFTLGRPDPLRNSPANRGHFFNPHENIALRTQDLRHVAGRFDQMGILLAQSCDQVGQAPSEFAWMRTGGIGLAPYGHYPAWSELYELATHLIGACSTQMHTAAELMMKVSYDFDVTDAAVEAKLTQQVDAIAPLDPISRSA